MRITVERLRVGLVAGACLLVMVLAGFFGYARYKVHKALVDLPGRLGATITKEFNGYTYSQSDHGKTVFTIHASKAVQHTDGTLTLHDVSMILYGKKGDRADRISGDEFEYDTKEEVIKAAGIVHLDLASPVAEGAQASDAAKHLDPGASGAGDTRDAAGAGHVVHITTSGLVYLKKLGIAATKEGIEFAFGGFTGHAVGAEYNSDSGDVVLQSALTMSGLDKGKPVALTASHGALDHAQSVAEFDDARYSSAGEVARADMARLHLRADGSVERIEGERHVSLEEAADGSVTSDRIDAALDEKSKPQTAVFTGNVHFAEDGPLRQAHGDSERANVRFDGQGHIDHALLVGKVRTTEVERRVGAATGIASQRDLSADSVELWLAAEGAGGKPLLRDAKASGSARMSSVAPDAKGGGITTTKLAGDLLLARFVPGDGVAELSTMHGVGHTLVQQISVKSGDQKSAGETLDAVFRPSGKGKGDVELATAVQQGGIVIDRIIPAKAAGSGAPPSAPEMQHATAAMAAFDANTSKLTLTADSRKGPGGAGEVRLRDAESEISAARVVMDQDTGDATAEGSVKVSYQQTGSGSASRQAEPVHVLAARAELNHDAGRATFYGRAADGRAGLARMWQAGTGGQGGSQVDAPVLVLEQEEKRLTARPEVAGALGTVHAVLANAPATKSMAGAADSTAVSAMAAGAGDAAGLGKTGNSAKVAASPAKGAGKSGSPGATRITSSLLVYSDLNRQAVFTGGVRVLDQDGEMRGQEATVYLSPASGSKAGETVGATAGVASSGAAANSAGSTAGPASSLTGLFGGNVERIVATQHIEITQPGRRATGERLVYTASDQMFVLTGTAADPPRVVDQVQGTTTGAMLRFHSGDENVVVSGTGGEGPSQRVRTETTMKAAAGGEPGSAGKASSGKTGSRGQGTKSRAAQDQGVGVKQN